MQQSTDQPTILRHLDYSALYRPISREQARPYKAGTWQNFWAAFAIIIFVMLFGSIFISSAVYLIPNATWWMVGLAYVLPVSLVLIAVNEYAYRTARQRARLDAFASQNNMKFTYLVENSQKVGMIFNEGHSRVVDARLSTAAYEIGNYKYTTGSGKNQQQHDYGYMQLTLPRRLPHMVLDAKSNNFWKFSNLPAMFKKEQVLTLEGNFDNYFTLYAPKQYERDALYVFTPDVMQHLIQYGQEFDMEVIDNNLFIYSSKMFALDKEEVLKKLFTIIAKIGDELESQTDFYADDAIGDRSVNLVAPQGARLKKSFNWLVIVFIVIYLVIYLSGFHS